MGNDDFEKFYAAAIATGCATSAQLKRLPRAVLKRIVSAAIYSENDRCVRIAEGFARRTAQTTAVIGPVISALVTKIRA